MTSINKVGLAAVGITSIAALAGAGIWWGGKSVYLAWRGEQVEETSELKPLVYENLADVAGDLQPKAPAANGDVAGVTELTDLGPVTESYLASLPENISEAEIFSQERLTAYLASLEEPSLTEVEITTNQAVGADAIETYLDQIAASHNLELTPVSLEDIESAWGLLIEEDASELRVIDSAIENNLTILKQVSAPEEVSDLHKKMVGATESLSRQIKRLLQLETDVVASLWGSYQIDQLQPVFTEIADEIVALEAKYGLE